MGYQEFSIESAVDLTTRNTPSTKIDGMKKTYGILTNPSRSTEEFIAGAISSLGQADRNIMYVNTSLEALSDRLAICAKVARPVNMAKARGVEGFQGVNYLNPWEYAIEGKVGDFFKKIWDAIKTIARKIIEAIVNFVKYISNAIASAGMKAQANDLAKFMRNKDNIMRKVKAAKVDEQSLNSIPWKLNAAQMEKLVQSAAAQYLKAVQANKADEAILQGVSRTDLKTFTSEKDFTSTFSKIFGLSVSGVVGNLHGEGKGAGVAYNGAKAKVQSLIDSMNKQIEDGVKIFHGAKSTSPKEVVQSAVCSSTKVESVKVKDIVKLAGNDFGCLSNEWLSANVTKVLAAMRQNEKLFTQYTKTIDAVAKKFDQVQAASHSNVASISQLCSQLAKARCQLNSFYSGIILELTSYVLRFRKNVHTALKMYLRVGYGTKVEKSGESLNAQSLEQMFTF